MDERVYLVCYDIHCPKRWRQVFKLMKGYGEWVQFSIFQCRHGAKRHAEMQHLLDGAIKNEEDHVLIVDLGPSDRVQPRFTSLGLGFQVMERGPKVV